MFGSGAHSQNDYFEKASKIGKKAEEICMDMYGIEYIDLCLCDPRKDIVWAKAEQAYYHENS